MAGIVAIMLYMELPRAVFESARTKEDMLVERGEEFKKAIRRYYVKNAAKWPQSIDDLEKSNGMRFLRRRYKDPMTGKDEWRLIHIGPMGLTDSKVTKPTNPAEQKEVRQSSIGEGVQVGGGNLTPAGPEGIQGVAMRQRPGDRLPTPEQRDLAFQSGPGAEQPPPAGVIPGQLGVPQEEGEQPVSGAPPGIDNPANQPPPPPGIQPFPSPEQPGVVPFPQGFPGGIGNPPSGGLTPAPFPGQPGGGQPGQPIQPPGMFPGQPAYQQPGAPGMAPGAVPTGQNPALDKIRELLTTPRQASVGGLVAGATQQPAFVGGIAGVASKYEGEGIKLINERSRIDEWEFVFDPAKDRRRQPANAGAATAGAAGVPGTGTPGQGNRTGPGAAGQPTPGFGGPSISIPGGFQPGPGGFPGSGSIPGYRPVTPPGRRQ